MGPPSLERICLEVLAWSTEPYWQLQKRRMQLLPEHAANTLLQLLLQFRRLHAPAQLDAFKDCATVLDVSAASGLHLDAEWLAHIGSLRQLHHLSITSMPRLRDKALPPLSSLAHQLTHLDLSHCSALTNRSLPVLGSLTQLCALLLTGTSLASPMLQHLSALQRLTRLHLGGCDVTDADISNHLSSFSTLQDLELWGTAAGDTSARYITHTLPALQHLSLSWTRVSSVLPVLPGLTWLDLSHCQLKGQVSEADFAAAAGLVALQVLLLVQAEVGALGCELLEAVIRASAGSLKALDLTKAQLHSQLPVLLALAGTTQLSALSLAGLDLQDDFLPALAPCSALQTLNLSANPDVSAAGLSAALQGCGAGLQRLDLSRTGVGNAVLPLLKHLPQLQQLVLEHTAVTWEAKAAAAAGDEGLAGQQAAAPVAGQQAVGGVVGDNAGRHAAGAAAPLLQQAVATVSEGVAPVGWRQLQVLNVCNTHLSEPGVMQLAADMTAAATAVGAAGGSCSRQQHAHSSSGLRVLLVGSNDRLGRKALTALCQLTSLQQLTLSNWQLTDRDVTVLQALQQLRQLHVQAADAWLLSNGALQALTEDLPQLSVITRDGTPLVQHPYSILAALPAAAGAYQPPSSSSSDLGKTPMPAAHSSCDAAARDGSNFLSRSIWPAGPLPEDPEAQQPHAASCHWLQGRAAQQAATSRTAQGRVAAAVSPAAGQKGPSIKQALGTQASARGCPGSGGSSSAGSSVYQRLAAFDERYRYSREELLTLQACSTGPARSVPAAVEPTGSSTGDLQAAPGPDQAPSSSDLCAVDFAAVLPAEIQLDAK